MESGVCDESFISYDNIPAPASNDSCHTEPLDMKSGAWFDDCTVNPSAVDNALHSGFDVHCAANEPDRYCSTDEQNNCSIVEARNAMTRLGLSFLRFQDVEMFRYWLSKCEFSEEEIQQDMNEMFANYGFNFPGQLMKKKRVPKPKNTNTPRSKKNNTGSSKKSNTGSSKKSNTGPKSNGRKNAKSKVKEYKTNNISSNVEEIGSVGLLGQPNIKREAEEFSESWIQENASAGYLADFSEDIKPIIAHVDSYADCNGDELKIDQCFRNTTFSTNNSTNNKTATMKPARTTDAKAKNMRIALKKGSEKKKKAPEKLEHETETTHVLNRKIKRPYVRHKIVDPDYNATPIDSETYRKKLLKTSPRLANPITKRKYNKVKKPPKCTDGAEGEGGTVTAGKPFSEMNSTLVRFLRYQCFVCPESIDEYPTRNALYKHIAKTHMIIDSNGSRVIPCYLCDKQMKMSRKCIDKKVLCLMLTHLIIKHNRGIPDFIAPFKCTHDGCTFATIREESLKSHIIRHTGDAKVTCDRCGRIMCNSGTLKRHLMFACLPPNTSTSTGTGTDMVPGAGTLIEEEKPELKVVRQTFSCELCDRTFLSRHAVDRHVVKFHEGRKDFLCSHCCSTFGEKRELIDHVFRMHRVNLTNKPIVYCGHCSFDTLSPAILRRHIRSNHEPDMKPKCKVCGRVCTNAWVLKRHMLGHQEKREKCHLCPYITTHKRILEAHIKAQHMGFKYQCSFCGYKTGYYANLCKHRRTTCKKFFTQRDAPREIETSVTASQSLDELFLAEHMRRNPNKPPALLTFNNSFDS